MTNFFRLIKCLLFGLPRRGCPGRLYDKNGVWWSCSYCCRSDYFLDRMPAFEARVVELEAKLAEAEANVAQLTEQRHVLSSKYTKWMERAMASEARATALLEASEGRGGGWMPIADEAKDGRRIEVYGQPDNTELLRFTAPAVYIAFWNKVDGNFNINDGVWVETTIKPTHYRELPSPPSAHGQETAREDFEAAILRACCCEDCDYPDCATCYPADARAVQRAARVLKIINIPPRAEFARAAIQHSGSPE